MIEVDLESKFHPQLLEVIQSALKNHADLDAILRAAYESRNANDIVFAISAEQSVTNKQLAIVAGREHLRETRQYEPGVWNDWPDVIPPRLNTEPFIDGKPLECDYWLLKLKNGRFITGKLTSQKNWIQIPEFMIEAFREFSQPASAQWLENQTEASSDEWNAFPKFQPETEDTFEVQLSDGRQRAVTWHRTLGWTFYADEIVAFKKIK